MEQKKTLWIIAAVGAFLLVVLGTAGFFYYSPANKNVPTIARVSPNVNNNSSSGWTNPPTQNSATNSNAQTSLIDISKDNVSKVTDVLVLTDNATTIDLNSLKNQLNSDSPLNVTSESQTQIQNPLQNQGQNINITVNIPETKETNYISEPIYDSTTKKSNTPMSVIDESNTKNETKVVKVENKKVESPVTKKSTSKAQTKVENTTVSATVNKTQTTKTQFWVQVAAYSNKKGAESARSVLDANKIPADIFTYQDAKGKLFYRVRVGPYTTKSEGEYWRSRIIKIDEFSKAESYVTSTTN